MYTIDKLIEHKYVTVSVLEDTSQIREWMQVKDFFAVMDERLCITAIVTMADIIRQQGEQLTDLDLDKPSISLGDNIYAVAEKMLEAGQAYLPVFDEERRFIGVISLMRLTEQLLEMARL